MIKVLKPIAQWAAIYLNAVKERIDEAHIRAEFEDMPARIDDGNPIWGITAQALGEEYDNMTGSMSVEQVIESLVESLKSSNEGDVTLVEKMVEILQLPNQSNVLSGATLIELRRALLNSRELNGLEERLKNAHLHCGECGKELRSGEVVVIRVGGIGHHDTSRFSCSACRIPQWIACGKSSCTTTISLADYAAGTRYCEEHKNTPRWDTVRIPFEALQV